MNRRILHVICGGLNSGKTTFARYLQIGKKDVYRICVEELEYSIGIEEHKIFRALLVILLQMGDVVVDGLENNSASYRKTIISMAASPEIDVYAYAVRRDVDKCVDENYSEDEIIASQQIDFPSLAEGFNKIMVVEWEDSTEPMIYGDEPLLIKPTIKIVEKLSDDRPAVVRPKKRAIKHKLERGRQNLFRPDKNL